jgi:hypothetical protein
MVSTKLAHFEAAWPDPGARMLLKPRLNVIANLASQPAETPADSDAKLISENREIATDIRVIKDMANEELGETRRATIECHLRALQSKPRANGMEPE